MSYCDLQFCCPYCRNALSLENKTFLCKECGEKFPFKDGIPSFTDNGYYYGSLPKGEAEHLIRMALQNGIGELKSYLAGLRIAGKKVFLKSFDDRSADGRFLLCLDRESVVLDLGCGFGAFSVPLSRVCKQVVGVDATFERIQFLDIRARQEGLSNLIPVHANLFELPLADSMFDCVVLNGVLEWTGEWREDMNPRDVQLLALKKAVHLLKPHGTLYLAIENRVGLEFLYGRMDHNKLYCTSFMPRKMADLVTKALRKKSYRTYTYTYGGYCKLLKDAGFSKIDFYCPWPRYQKPRHIIRWGDKAAFTYFRKRILKDLNFREYVMFTLLSWVHLNWLLSPSFIILAQKE